MKNNLSTNQVKLPFGLKDGKLIHISNVPSGLACECICASCHAPLVAKKGQKNAHCFAHYKADECAHAVETALHYAAKQVLEESAQITLPELLISEQVSGEICGQSISKSGSLKACNKHTVIIEDIKLEQSLGRIIPDVMAFINGAWFLIEIAVTHFVDETKEQKLQDLKIPCIEIDLSTVDRDADLDDIRKEVVDSVSNKKWLFHPATEVIRVNLRSSLELELQEELNQIFEKEQESKRIKNELHQQRIAREKAILEKIRPSINLLESYVRDKESYLTKYKHQLHTQPIWRRAVSIMDVSVESLPHFLNQPIKGESIFACDRMAWQAILFAVFIYKKSQKYDEPYPISVYKMTEWCKKYAPLNHFALNIWPHKKLIDPNIIALLEGFDLYTAIRQFTVHLEKKGILKSYCYGHYKIENDTLPINKIDSFEGNQLLQGIYQSELEALSACDQEKFQERAGILEFCHGFSKFNAEKRAYDEICLS